MSYVEHALSLFAVNRAQEQQLHPVRTSILIAPNRPGKGFCETCQCHKPAPKVRLKGWECDDCVLKSGS